MAALTSTFLPKSTVYSPSLSNAKVPRGSGGRMRITCRKKDLHPDFHEYWKVYCNGELVMTTFRDDLSFSCNMMSGRHYCRSIE